MIKIENFFKNSRDFLSRPQSSIFSAAIVISFTYGISMVLGILRERILVAKFYECCRGGLDSYFAAFRIPDIIFQLVVIGALSSAFIPVFSDSLSKDKKEAYKLASSLINLLLVFFLIFAIIVFFFAKPLSLLITGNFSYYQIELMSGMTRLMLIAQVFFLVSNFLSAMIQTQQRFLLPSLSPIVYNLGIIVCIYFLSGILGIWSAAWGVVLGAFLHLIIQVPLVFKLGFKYRFSFDWKNSSVRKVFRLMLPRTLALAASQLEITVAVFLATSLSAGSLTIYNLAHRLADLPVRLLGTSIGQAALPILSSQLARGEKDNFKQTLSKSLSQILYLAFPITGLFLILRLQAVRFAYGAKSFPWEATLVTGRTLAVITLSIFSQSAIQLLVRGFYAFHDTVTPFCISLVSVVINIGLSLFFVNNLNWGIFGVALAFTISNFVNFILLFIFLNYKKERFIFNSDLFRYLKMMIFAGISSFSAWVCLRLLDTFVFDTSKSFPLLLLTAISSAVGIGVYLLLSVIFKIEEFGGILKQIQKFGKWRSTVFSVEEIIEPHSGTTTSV